MFAFAPPVAYVAHVAIFVVVIRVESKYEPLETEPVEEYDEYGDAGYDVPAAVLPGSIVEVWA